MNHQVPSIKILSGTETAQKIQKLFFTMAESVLACQSNMSTLKSVAMKVAGKNTAVTRASVFIAMLSNPARALISALLLLSS